LVAGTVEVFWSVVACDESAVEVETVEPSAARNGRATPSVTTVTSVMSKEGLAFITGV